LYDLTIVNFKLKPPVYTCARSPFIYNPTWAKKKKKVELSQN
jgi:hypothetical protein